MKLQRLILLASLTVKLGYDVKAIRSALNKYAQKQNASPTVSTPTTGPTPTVCSSTTVMDDTDRISLGLCERCPSRAATLWQRDALLITFCGHHDREHMDALASQGFMRTAVDMSVFGVHA